MSWWPEIMVWSAALIFAGALFVGANWQARRMDEREAEWKRFDK